MPERFILLDCIIWIFLFGCVASAPPNITRLSNESEEHITEKLVSRLGDTPTIVCSAESEEDPLILTFSRNSTQELLGRVRGRQLIFGFHSLTCADTDDYVCTASNRDGSVSRSISIDVLCPPSLIRSDKQTKRSPQLQGEVGKDFRTFIDIHSSPRPYALTLVLANTEDIIASRDLSEADENTERSSGNPRYTLGLVPSVFPEWAVTVDIHGLKRQDVGRIYVLIVENGQSPALRYTFEIADASTTSSPSNGSLPSKLALGLGIPLSLMTFALLLFIAWVVCKRRRGSLNLPSFMDNIQTRRRQKAVYKEDVRATELDSPAVNGSNGFFDNLNYNPSPRPSLRNDYDNHAYSENPNQSTLPVSYTSSESPNDDEQVYNEPEINVYENGTEVKFATSEITREKENVGNSRLSTLSQTRGSDVELSSPSSPEVSMAAAETRMATVD